MRVTSFADHRIVTTTPLSPNTNTHGTAFAGSLYAIEALTAWGVIYLELEQANIDASIIHASGHIEFAKPVTEDIVATTHFRAHADILAQLKQHGKVRFDLETQVLTQGSVASQFKGTYVVRLNQ